MGDLQHFHVEEQKESHLGANLIGAAIVVVGLCVIGLYVYESGMWNPVASQSFTTSHSFSSGAQ